MFKRSPPRRRDVYKHSKTVKNPENMDNLYCILHSLMNAVQNETGEKNLSNFFFDGRWTKFLCPTLPCPFVISILDTLLSLHLWN